jgi:hypothetical protein
MGLFKKSPKNNNGTPVNTGNTVGINRDLFPEAGGIPGQVTAAEVSKGLNAVYEFLQSDYESKGYNDALTNPDESYKADNIKLYHHDLLLILDRSQVYYDELQKELDFHISSRSRAGLIDLVEELKIRKEMVTDHISKLKAIKEDAISGSGATQRIALSYQRGFMRGLSAISQSKLFNRNL